MSLARMSAGQGYRYLLRHTACGDAAREAGTSLTSYYVASGYPPGYWRGAGLAGLDDSRGLRPGTAVTEEAMARLFGTGHDPVTDAALGRPYPAFRSLDQRIAEATAALPDDLSADERAEAIAAIETREQARPARVAVAGFDLTFTVPKSASVLWALGDADVQAAIAEAHRASVSGVLEMIETRFLRTRVGKHSCAQVGTRGMIAAAFDHWDTRTGDPNLHTHVVIANKVQGPDGRWRSVDSRALHHAAVACSEIYDDLIADEIASRLPVTWGWRNRGERRNPAFEIDGVPEELLAVFSGRAAQIEAVLRELLEAFTDRHGRAPSRRQVLRLRQQATLSTRPDKQVRPLVQLLARWRTTASATTGTATDQVLHSVWRRGYRQRVSAVEVAPTIVEALADATVIAAGERRSTWTRPNLLAEAARASRPLRMGSATDRIALLDRVVTVALTRCVPLDPPAVFDTPTRFRRADGTSAFDRPDEHAFTTRALLEAEARLLAAAQTTGAPQAPLDHAGIGLDTAGGTTSGDATRDQAMMRPSSTGGPVVARLSADQRAAVATIATSGRRLDVLVGPAGTGKTRTLNALRQVWQHDHGPGSVIGLAPSSTAAAELAAALGIPCENTAKWLHDTTHGTPGSPVGPGLPAEVGLRAGQLLIVDEASMVATTDLDTLTAQAGAAGAKLLLVGDHHQLGAVGAGGAFALLAEAGTPATLTGLWRFRHRWEAHATRALRLGDPVALDAYAAHGRLHDGPAELMLDAVYRAWERDITDGRAAIMLAADRSTVTGLNTRAHDERVTRGIVSGDGIPLADDTAAGRGDLVITRRNNRHLTTRHCSTAEGSTADGSTAVGYVRNGARWRIQDVHPDGAIDVLPLENAPAGSGATSRSGGVVRLPADYVREHVELGYATTVHRAQGMTVDAAHVLITPGLTRQTLYVAMTRGREANHAYVATDRLDPTCPQPPGLPAAPGGRAVLERILATDGAEQSATATLRQRQADATSFRRLLPIRDTFTDAAQRGDPECGVAAGAVTSLLRLQALALHHERLAEQQDERDSDPGYDQPWLSPPADRFEGMHR